MISNASKIILTLHSFQIILIKLKSSYSYELNKIDNDKNCR